MWCWFQLQVINNASIQVMNINKLDHQQYRYKFVNTDKKYLSMRRVVPSVRYSQTPQIAGLTYTDGSPLTLTLHSVTRNLMISSCPLRPTSPNMVSLDLVTGAVVGGNNNGNDMNNLVVDTTASNRLKL